MAVRTVLVDDIDGGDADVTIAFVVNGKSYSIDLSNKNADKFWKALDPFIKACTKDDGRAAVIAEHERNLERRNEIRRWARDNGYEIADRGRIPVDIEEAFEEANGA